MYLLFETQSFMHTGGNSGKTITHKKPFTPTFICPSTSVTAELKTFVLSDRCDGLGKAANLV